MDTMGHHRLQLFERLLGRHETEGRVGDGLRPGLLRLAWFYFIDLDTAN
jgi:hypothetical protein